MMRKKCVKLSCLSRSRSSRKWMPWSKPYGRAPRVAPGWSRPSGRRWSGTVTSPREREASDTTWTKGGEAVLSCRWASTHDWCLSRLSLQTKEYPMSHDAPRHDLQGAVSPQNTLGQRLREVDGNLPEPLRTQCLAAGTAF